MNRNMAVASTIVLIVILGTAVSQQSCPSKSFGLGCKYRCNCENWSCDSTGECTGRTKCRDGWFGQSCQYADVAFDSTVRRNTTSGTRSIVYSGSCIGNSNNIQSVSVTSKADYHFTWMRLTFHNRGFSADINVGFRRNNSYIDCLKLRVSTDGSTYLDIFCNSEIIINEVVLTGTGIASLCFAQISGGRNIALYLEPTQSSVYERHIAKKAVDGEKSGNFYYCSCTNGGDSSPSWTLTFSKPHQIHRFLLYNRDKQQERLKGFIIHSYENENKLVYNYKDTIRSEQNLYQVTPESLLKNVLFVDILSQNEYFTICEAEIYGDVNCPAGKYGIDCEKQCNCAVIGEACFVSTGDCPSGCSPGFYGKGCNSNCPDKFYDIDCKKRCSQNCLNEYCNKVSGTCISCVPGKQGDFCEKDCNPGRYGPKCQEPCSQNCGGNGSCDGQTGFCSECKPGYMGDTCAKNCSAYTFGSGCIFSCSTNCTNQTCRSDSGHCFGCVTGYIGTFCEKVYSAPSESEDSTAVIIGLVVALTIIILVAVTVVLVWRKTHRKSGTSSRLQLEIQDNDDVQNVFAKSEKMKTAKEVPSKDEMETENMPREQYINFNQVQVSTAIPVKDLHTFLLSHKADYFKHQFEKVPNISPEATTYVANSNENRKKNRYKNICAYDQSRVNLVRNDEKNEGDYINASYVKGYGNKERFIASQGPSNVIIEDFIRMLWEQKVDKVVMLTHLVEDGKHKCERYWPEDKKIMFGDIQVKLAATQVFAHYTIRKLRLKKDGDRHNLTHFHFTSWSDKGVPATPWGLIEFEQIVFACPTLKPIVVHCSAGVGRTGTFIGLRNVMIEAKETGCIDFYTTLLNLRKDRMNMIQTSEQYYFLHKAAEVSLLCLNTTVEASDITERINFLKRRVSGMTNLEIEFNSICDACAIDKDEANVSQSDDTEYNNSMILVNKHKNRFNNILPNEVYRPHLNGADDKEGGDYINAVLLPSFTRPDYQILTQLPLPSTVADFWRLVTQYKVSLIVEFEQDLKAKDSTIGDYLPEGENNSLKVDSFIIEARLSASEQYWMQQELLITTNAANKNVETSSSINSVEHRLTYLKCVNTDLDSTKLLALAEKTRSHNSADKGRTLFMCRNGAAYSGLVYVLTLLLDRMDSDNLLTIPLIVGATKVIQPHVIPSVKQYRVLYEVLNQYQESTSVYGNIGNVNQGLSSTPQPQKKPREVKKSKNISTESEMFNNDNVYGNSMS